MSEELIREDDHVLDIMTCYQTMYLSAPNSFRRLRSYVQAFYSVLQSLGSTWYSKHSIPSIKISPKLHIPFYMPKLTKSCIFHPRGSSRRADSRSSASIPAEISGPLANSRILLPGSAPSYEPASIPGHVSHNARIPTSPFHIVFSMTIFLRVASARPIEKVTDTSSSSCMPSTLAIVVAAVSAISLIVVSIYLGVWNIPEKVYLPLTGFTSVMAMMVVNKSDQMPIYGPYVISYLWIILATILVRIERNRFPENQRDLFIVTLFLTFLSSWWMVASAHPNDFMAAIPVCFIFSIFIVTRLRRLLFALLNAVIGVLPHTNEERTEDRSSASAAF